MKRRSTQQGLDTTTSLRHGRRTAALMSVISALGGRRAAPPKSTELWVGQRPHTPRQCLGVSHLQEKGGTAGHAYMHICRHCAFSCTHTEPGRGCGLSVLVAAEEVWDMTHCC